MRGISDSNHRPPAQERKGHHRGRAPEAPNHSGILQSRVSNKHQDAVAMNLLLVSSSISSRPGAELARLSAHQEDPLGRVGTWAEAVVVTGFGDHSLLSSSGGAAAGC